MAISQNTAGAYLGYTLGRALPTLYFTNGRYTQIYPQANNIGWHPNRAHYRGSNITAAAHATIMAIRVTDPVDPRETAFIANFRAGNFDSNAADALFFECSSDDGVNWSAHPSSSRLIELGDVNFDNTYDNAYANGVLAAGVLAPNG